MSSDICVQLGRRIRLLRRRSAYTQEELARRAQIARESLSRIESGKREVGVYVLKRIAKALDTPLEELFKGL